MISTAFWTGLPVNTIWNMISVLFSLSFEISAARNETFLNKRLLEDLRYINLKTCLCLLILFLHHQVFFNESNPLTFSAQTLDLSMLQWKYYNTLKISVQCILYSRECMLQQNIITHSFYSLYFLFKGMWLGKILTKVLGSSENCVKSSKRMLVENTCWSS